MVNVSVSLFCELKIGNSSELIAILHSPSNWFVKHIRKFKLPIYLQFYTLATSNVNKMISRANLKNSLLQINSQKANCPLEIRID
jgi:hypothetical protein